MTITEPTFAPVAPAASVELAEAPIATSTNASKPRTIRMLSVYDAVRFKFWYCGSSTRNVRRASSGVEVVEAIAQKPNHLPVIRGDMRLVVVFPLLVQSCGALVVPASALRLYSRPRKCIEPPQPERLPFGHGAAGRANRFTASMVDGGDPPTQGSSTDDEDGGINVVKARLSKPVGLLLAEKETGLPGLVVDGIAEGGSAKVRKRESGVKRDMCILHILS